jgi:LmbE family N-acetylglucosaminyl deacetylase
VNAKRAKVAMCLMAHPDDCEFLAAGTLALLAEREWEIHIVTMTPGDVGSATLAPEAIAEIRRREAARAAAVIGAAYHCVESRDLYVMYDASTLRRVIGLTRHISPSLVITHSPDCYLVDHEITAQLARTASFGYSVPNAVPGPVPKRACVPHLYYADPLEGVDALGRAVVPTTWIDITSAMARKTRMLHCHASQRDWLRAHHGMDQYTRSMKEWGKRRGAGAGVRYAEGFRQHLGHGHPHDDLLKEELGPLVRGASPA